MAFGGGKEPTLISPLISSIEVIDHSKYMCDFTPANTRKRKQGMYRKIPEENFRSVGFNQEEGFNLPLRMTVEGLDIAGKQFLENTHLTYISHQGSSFWLRALVKEGTDLKLSIDLPANLAQDADLKLVIRGKVVFIEAPKSKDNRQRISLKFENKYIIQPEK